MSYFPDYALGTRGWEHQVKPGREVCNLGRKVTCSAEADPGALAMPDLSHLNFNPALGSKPNQLDRPTFIVRDRLNGRNRRGADGRCRRIADVADRGLGRLNWVVRGFKEVDTQLRAVSFDHLIRGGEEGRRDVDPERFGRLQIDGGSKLRRELDRD